MTSRFFWSIFTGLFLCTSGIISYTYAADSPPEYLPGHIIVKLEDDQTFFRHYDDTGEAGKKRRDRGGVSGDRPDNPAAMLENRLQSHGLQSMKPVFRSGAASAVAARARAHPGASPDRLEELARGFERTYYIRYSSAEDPLQLSGEIGQIPGVVYAEPHYVHRTAQAYTPNDSLIGAAGHDYFEYQNFFNAWSVSTGSPDVVIAIVDSGVYYDHPDLRNKLWENPEPGRADEYFEGWEIVNDTIGWNFWESGDIFNGEEPEQNADPVGNFSSHGTHVAGIAAADTDNEIGVAGTGFHSQFMPVKTGGTEQYPTTIAYGYPGILYAAVNDADIINCSFGGTNFSEYGKEVVEYAFESGSLVVAAAGNEGDDTAFFPAAYDNVLTVGSVKREYNDVISHFSNYGYYVDVFAMGEGVLSTFFDYDEDEVSWDPRYARNTGTSMAAPVVSGLAALIKAENPEWSPQRIASQIRTNGRSIDAENPDSKYDNKLGAGLIDAHAALTNHNPGLYITDFSFEAADGSKLNIGESGTLILSGFNYGEATSGATMEIESQQEGFTIQPESQNSGVVPTGSEFEVSFDVTISRDFQLDRVPEFRLDMTDEALGYHDFFMFRYERLLYEILDINEIAVSISSDGTIGFLDALTSSGGIGFIPGEFNNVLFEGGLMISADVESSFSNDDEPVIINQVRDSTDITRHFLPEDNLRFSRPGELSDIDGKAHFHSNLHPVADELSIKMQTYAFSTSSLEKTFFIRYTITNNSNSTLSNMHVGLFNDWDLHLDFENDRTVYIEEDSLLYAHDPQGAPYVAVAHMGAVSSAFAIDNASQMSLPNATTREDSLRFGVYYREDEARFDGFTDAEKRLALTAGTERTDIPGADISVVTGTGPFTLLPLASVDVGFIYAWGSSVHDLRSQVSTARNLNLFDVSEPGEYSQFREVSDRLTLFQNFPNPFNKETMIEFHLPETGHAELTVYNMLGQRITTLVDDNVEQRANFALFDASGLASGIYVAVLRSGGRTETIKMSLVK